MNLLQPTVETLRQYAYGELDAEKANAVRAWLMVLASPDAVRAYDAILIERSLRERRLAEAFSHPVRARLRWLCRKLRDDTLDSLESLLEVTQSMQPITAVSTLGRPSTTGPGQLVFEMTPDEPVDIVVHLKRSVFVAVFALEGVGLVHTLFASPVKQAANSVIEAQSLVLNSGDDAVDIFCILSEDQPIEERPDYADARWLAGLLERAADSAGRFHVVKGTIAVAGMAPFGKED